MSERLLNKDYHPEPYWSDVAKRIKKRQQKEGKVVAGDDEPYYRYKRKKFLKLLNKINFEGRSVLEIGCGPGGNLLEVLRRNPKSLTGVDISKEMVELAKSKVPSSVELRHVNGTELPFKDKSYDLIFTATVLQHNTDDGMLRSLMKDICRVSSSQIVLFERIEGKIKGDELCLGRPVSYYEAIMAEYGFALQYKDFINIRVSYYVSGIIRKALNSGKRKEGEPLNGLSNFLQKITLPITRILDNVFTSSKDLAMLEFYRRDNIRSTVAKTWGKN